MKVINNKKEAWDFLRDLTSDMTLELNPVGHLNLSNVIGEYNAVWRSRHNIEGLQEPIMLLRSTLRPIEDPVQVYDIKFDPFHGWVNFELSNTATKASPFREAMVKCLELGQAVNVLCEAASITYARIVASNHFKGLITIRITDGGVSIAPRGLNKRESVATLIRRYAEEAFLVPNTTISIPLDSNQVAYARNIAQSFKKDGVRLSVTTDGNSIQISAKTIVSPLQEAVNNLAVSVKIGLFSWDQVREAISQQEKPMEVEPAADLFKVDQEELI